MKINNQEYLKISVIIPAKPGSDCQETLSALRKVDYRQNNFEIILALGCQPSVQRNQAAIKAKGEILYFLDNDSLIHPQAFKETLSVINNQFFKAKKVNGRGFSIFPVWLSRIIKDIFFSGTIYQGEIGAVGGPNVWEDKETFWPLMAGTVLESFFAHYKMAARYRPIGLTHRASEKELILCNLAIRKSIFQKVGGFNEKLYPNEENELLNRIDKAGYQLVYNPRQLVFRRRRQKFSSILTTFFRYGRGRMEEARIEGFLPNWPFLLPLVFLVYLLLLLFYHPLWLYFLLLVYLLLAVGSALGFAARKKKSYLLFFLPLFYLISHLAYGLGLIKGLTTDLHKKAVLSGRTNVELKVVKSFQKWQNGG